MDYYLYTAEYRYPPSNNGTNTMNTNKINTLEKIIAITLIGGAALLGGCSKAEPEQVRKPYFPNQEITFISLTPEDVRKNELNLQLADDYFKIAEKVERIGDELSGFDGYKITFHDEWSGAECIKIIEKHPELEKRYSAIIPKEYSR